MVCHGDYRLDNLVFTHPHEPSSHPRLTAVLDWELSTLVGVHGPTWGLDTPHATLAADL